MDVETFFDRIRKNLIDITNRELTNWVQQVYERLHGLDLGWRWRMKTEA